MKYNLIGLNLFNTKMFLRSSSSEHLVQICISQASVVSFKDKISLEFTLRFLAIGTLDRKSQMSTWKPKWSVDHSQRTQFPTFNLKYFFEVEWEIKKPGVDAILENV